MDHTISIVVHAFNLSYTLHYILHIHEILDNQDQHESNGQMYLTKYYTKLYVIIDSNLNCKF